MNERKKRRKLEIDLSPPSEGMQKVEAEIRAFRALKSSMKKLIQHEVDKAVRKAVGNLSRSKQKTKAAKSH